MPSKKGWKMSEQGKKNISEAMKGKKYTKEHKRNISKGVRKFWAKVRLWEEESKK